MISESRFTAVTQVDDTGEPPFALDRSARRDTVLSMQPRVQRPVDVAALVRPATTP